MCYNFAIHNTGASLNALSLSLNTVIMGKLIPGRLETPTMFYKSCFLQMEMPSLQDRDDT